MLSCKGEEGKEEEEEEEEEEDEEEEVMDSAMQVSGPGGHSPCEPGRGRKDGRHQPQSS